LQTQRTALGAYTSAYIGRWRGTYPGV